MNVIVFGAAGKTGSLVVEKLRAAGHAVTVFTRGGAEHGDGVRVMKGDAGDMDAVQRAVMNQDAVIDTIGGKTPYKHTDLETAAARNILAGMQAAGAKRFIVVSALGAGDSMGQAPLWYQYLLIPIFLRGSTQDKTNMEAAVRASGVPFVIVRPPMLTDKPATGSIRIVPPGQKAKTITRADLAQFLVEQLDTDANIGKSVVVAND